MSPQMDALVQLTIPSGEHPRSTMLLTTKVWPSQVKGGPGLSDASNLAVGAVSYLQLINKNEQTQVFPSTFARRLNISSTIVFIRILSEPKVS